MQIKLVGTEQQLKLKGNIVNVENDLDVCAKAIPRRFHEMATIQIKFSRRLTDQAPVWYEVVRPAVVEKAKAVLMGTELYVENKIESRCDFTNLSGNKPIKAEHITSLRHIIHSCVISEIFKIHADRISKMRNTATLSQILSKLYIIFPLKTTFGT